MIDDDLRRSIEHLQDLFEGRRVVSVERRVYEFGPVDYPVFKLDDGSEVVVLDGWGRSPIAEREN